MSELKTYWFCAKCNVRKEVLTIGQNEEKTCEICGETIPPHKGNCIWMDDSTLSYMKKRHEVKKMLDARHREEWYKTERRFLFGDKP